MSYKSSEQRALHHHQHHCCCCCSPAGAVGQLVAASFSNMGSLYLTVEGAAKTHVNNLITAKAAVLEGLLGECH